jgi:hypothetical protein
MRNFTVGSIVRYEDCYYRVSADKGCGDKRWVNLRAIFGNKVYYKQIPANQVVEAEQEWYARWSKSETYMCM